MPIKSRKLKKRKLSKRKKQTRSKRGGAFAVASAMKSIAQRIQGFLPDHVYMFRGHGCTIPYPKKHWREYPIVPKNCIYITFGEILKTVDVSGGDDGYFYDNFLKLFYNNSPLLRNPVKYETELNHTIFRKADGTLALDKSRNVRKLHLHYSDYYGIKPPNEKMKHYKDAFYERHLISVGLGEHVGPEPPVPWGNINDAIFDRLIGKYKKHISDYFLGDLVLSSPSNFEDPRQMQYVNKIQNFLSEEGRVTLSDIKFNELLKKCEGSDFTNDEQLLYIPVLKKMIQIILNLTESGEKMPVQILRFFKKSGFYEMGTIKKSDKKKIINIKNYLLISEQEQKDIYSSSIDKIKVDGKDILITPSLIIPEYFKKAINQEEITQITKKTNLINELSKSPKENRNMTIYDFLKIIQKQELIKQSDLMKAKPGIHYNFVCRSLCSTEDISKTNLENMKKMMRAQSEI